MIRVTDAQIAVRIERPLFERRLKLGARDAEEASVDTPQPAFSRVLSPARSLDWCAGRRPECRVYDIEHARVYDEALPSIFNKGKRAI